MPSAETNHFWRFSLDFYQRDGVAEACLTLQDHLGLDVNILLYAAWLASQGRTASVADFEQVDLLIAPWRDEVIRPLRRIRRWLKEPGPDAPAGSVLEYRAGIKSAELEAEKIAQDMIFASNLRSRKPDGDGPGDIRAALSNYLKMRDVSPDNDAARELDAIYAAFDQLV